MPYCQDGSALRRVPFEHDLADKAHMMIADHFNGLEKFESGLWKIADNLRANSNLASNEYFMPIMGLIFLRHATNRFYEAKAAIEADKAVGKIPDRALVEADFTRRRARSQISRGVGRPPHRPPPAARLPAGRDRPWAG